MNQHNTQVSGAILTACCLGFSLLASPAGAEISQTAQVNAMVGIHPMVELNCTPLRLGVWRVPLRKVSMPSLVMLDIDLPQQGVKLYQNTAIALASGRSDWLPVYSTCKLTNSSAVDMTSADVSISNNRNLKVKGDGSAYSGIHEPRVPAAGILVNVYTVNLTRIKNGESTFFVGGSVSFPANIVSGNHGAYSLLSYPTVRVDDGMN